jgi:hypothetical protein
LEDVAMRHCESSVLITTTPEEAFAFIDDHTRFSSHMNESSWMMGGGRMSVELDAARGKAVGSHIRLSGRVFGVGLSLDEVVTQRNPPTNKVWETVGVPRLLVIGPYAMGVEITPVDNGSRIRVFIDYELPKGWATYWLGLLFSRVYARWCVDQMIKGAAQNLASNHPVAA